MIIKFNFLYIVILFAISLLPAQQDSAKRIGAQSTIPNSPLPPFESSETHSPINAETKIASLVSDHYQYPFFIEGDAIKISIYQDSALFLNGFYKIDQNGFITLPLVGLMSVKNMSKSQFVDFLKRQYTDYLRFPNINVTSLIRVSFFGGFNKPGLYWVESGNSFWDAIQIAGGVSREDGLKKIRWERDGLVVSNNIISDFQNGASLQSIGFKSGDQLCVTSRPKQQFWEHFSQDFIPVFSLSLSTIATAVSAYQAYKIYNK